MTTNKAKIDLFDQIEDVVYDVGENESRECLGFHNGGLVICNGLHYKPVTVGQSIDWLLQVKEGERAGRYDCSDSSYEGQIQWLRMAQATLVV